MPRVSLNFTSAPASLRFFSTQEIRVPTRDRALGNGASQFSFPSAYFGSRVTRFQDGIRLVPRRSRRVFTFRRFCILQPV